MLLFKKLSKLVMCMSTRAMITESANQDREDCYRLQSELAIKYPKNPLIGLYNGDFTVSFYRKYFDVDSQEQLIVRMQEGTRDPLFTRGPNSCSALCDAEWRAFRKYTDDLKFALKACIDLIES